MLIYRLNWECLLDLALRFQSTSQMKCLDVNRSHYVAPFNRWWSIQILSRHVRIRIVAWSRKSDRESTTKISPRIHRSPSGAFNLSLYNSSDERLRLNHFQMNRCPIRVRRVLTHLCEDRWSRFDSHDHTLHILTPHLCIKTKKNNHTWQKSKWMDGYIRYEWLMSWGKSWKGCLISLITQACTYPHTHAYAHTRAHTHDNMLIRHDNTWLLIHIKA